MARTGPSRAAARHARRPPRKRTPSDARANGNRRRSGASRRRSRGARARRVRILLITSAASLAVLGLLAAVALASTVMRGFGDCRIAALVPQRSAVSASGWDAEQLDNAAVIMRAGSDLGLSARDQAIAVMTAMGESSLRNLDYGDWETSGVTNPDGSRTTSIGLFQQQDGWGTREQRLDPYAAASLFYRAMTKVVPEVERHGLAPTLVAHRTQINADPQHYARYWPAAVRVVEQLSGSETGLDAATGAQECPRG